MSEKFNYTEAIEEMSAVYKLSKSIKEIATLTAALDEACDKITEILNYCPAIDYEWCKMGNKETCWPEDGKETKCWREYFLEKAKE